MKNKVIPSVFLYIILLLANSTTAAAQNHAAALAAADSSRFSINNNGGWQLFNAYIGQYKTDSAQMELIVQRPNNVNWSQERYVGKIKYGPLKPASNQNIGVNWAGGNYVVRMEPNGKCWLRFINGSLPAVNPAVFLLKVYYKP
jgi:hypothetical protein